MNYSNWVVLLVWLVLLYVNGVVFFLKGFLLTRREIHSKSSITDETSCCLPAKYKQVIILIIDALRYDFLAYQNISGVDKEMYHNNLPIVNQLLNDNPNNSALYKFIADPPTTTLQRLKGITTGSLPTFIDLGSNFASDELTEDNIISQMTSLNMNLTFMGDDTWMGLFPTSFQHSYPFPSFDVFDIDTVDRGVESHLFTEMSNSSWNLLVAHCLGVDHVGHRYGPQHLTMPLKLAQMNDVIQRIVNSMDPFSLLLVMGDHGMTRSGDHGGDSDDEVQAGLFAYSPRYRIKYKPESPDVSQVDIVPTLALLFGIPIPYSNLGSVILDLVYPHFTKDSEFEFYCNALYLNVKQIWRYLLSYNAELAFPPKEFYRLNEQSEKIKLAFKTLEHSDPEEFIHMCQSFLAEAKEMCRTIWAKFDLKFITIGLVIFFSVLLLHIASLVIGNTFPTWIIFVGIIGAVTSLLLQSEVLAAVVSVIPVLVLFAAGRKLKRLPDLTLLVPLILAGSYTSNSFVIQEPYVVMYLTQSLIWIPWLMRRTLNGNGLPLRVGLSLVSRLGLVFFRCREEQLPDCAIFNLHRSLTSLSATGFIVAFRILVASGSLLASYLLLRRYLIIGKRIMYLVFIVWGHWILQAISTVVDLDPKMLTFLPKLSYISFLLLLFHQLHSKSTSYCTKASNIVLLSTTVSLLLAGDGLAPGLLLTLLSIVGLMQLNPCAKEFWLLYSMLSLQGFFTTGHHTSLANIPWETAFVGFSHSNSPSLLANLLPAILVSYSTAFSLFLHAVALPLVALYSARKHNEASKSALIKGSSYYLLFHAIRLFGCMGSAAIHRRHLMIWKIFAPRLLYELLFALYTSVGLVASIMLHQLSAM